MTKRALKSITAESAYDIIKSPLITEKATFLTQNNQYSFKVDTRANKDEIAKAIAKIFKVDVLSVNTVNVFGKKKVFKGHHGVRSDFKKAIVRLKQGQTIDANVGV